jgi:predicted homoserine dehydrogenase-like protein
LLPLGLAQGVRLKRAVAEGECLRWSDVEHAAGDLAVRIRREMEAQFGSRPAATPPAT